MNTPDITPDVIHNVDDNYQQKHEQDEQQYLELADKPLSLDKLSYAELQKKEAALIKTIFDSEE